MKKLFVTSTLLFLFNSLFAQLFSIGGIDVGFLYVGPKVGMNLSQISNWEPMFGYENKNRLGFQMGAVGELGFTERFSIDGELVFISKGRKQTTTFAEQKMNVQYLGIPLLAQYSFKVLGLSKVYAKGGTFTNIRTGGSSEFIYEEGEEYSEPLSQEGWTRVDFGLSFGCGAEYETDIGIWGLDLRYDQGVVDVHKSDPEKNRNRTFGLTLVYKVDMFDLMRKMGKKD